MRSSDAAQQSKASQRQVSRRGFTRLLGGLGIASLAGCAGAPATARAEALVGDDSQGDGVPGTFDVRAFGATGDGTTDDSPAFQRAVDAAIASGGGTILVPQGRFRIRQCVRIVADASHDPSILFLGSGSSVVLIDTPSALTFYGGNSGLVVFRQLVFIGFDQDRLDDCSVGFYFGYNSQLVFDECLFLGIGASQHIVNSDAGLLVRNCRFGGCTTTRGAMVFAGYGAPFRLFEISGCYFVDYGSFGGVFYSKTPHGVIAWVGTGMTSGGSGAFDSSTVRVERCGFDEGAFHVLKMNGDGSRARVNIEDCNWLMNLCSGAAAIVLANVSSASIRRFSVDARTRGAGLACFLMASRCDRVVVEHCVETRGENPVRISATQDCATVEIDDSEYADLQCEATITLGSSNGVRWRLCKTDGAVLANALVTVGSSANRIVQLPSDASVRRATGVSLDAATAANQFVRVVEQQGQLVSILADGTPIAAGALLTSSSTVAGSVQAEPDPAAPAVGLAMEASSCGLVRVLWGRGVA